EETVTFGMDTGLKKINELSELKLEDVYGTHYTLQNLGGKPGLQASPVTCGSRPAKVLARRQESLLESDYDNPDTYGDDRILGGNFASHGEVPWQANIRIMTRNKDRTEYKPECSGAIINEYWIITVAHCVKGEAPSSFRVTVGDHHLARNDEGEQQFAVSKVISHENYRLGSFDYDIAILKIQPTKSGAGIKFNSFVQPICLPKETDYPGVGTHMIVSGWGRDKLSGASSQPILKMSMLPLIDQKECSQLFKGQITLRQFCAGYKNGPTDICRGDSGAPAAYLFAEMYILYGVASFGTDCPFPNYPSAFTNVRSYQHWIIKNMQLRSDNKLERTLPDRPHWSDS
ncbi:unnamed protein product, partial [Candidula unifasciata]